MIVYFHNPMRIILCMFDKDRVEASKWEACFSFLNECNKLSYKWRVLDSLDRWQSNTFADHQKSTLCVRKFLIIITAFVRWNERNLGLVLMNWSISIMFTFHALRQFIFEYLVAYHKVRNYLSISVLCNVFNFIQHIIFKYE